MWREKIVSTELLSDTQYRIFWESRSTENKLVIQKCENPFYEFFYS